MAIRHRFICFSRLCRLAGKRECQLRKVLHQLSFEGLRGPTRSIFREKEMTRNNNYRLIDTRIDKGVLGVHDPTRPFCVVVTDRTTGRIMHVWRYASTKGAQGRMRQCRRPT